MQLQILSRRGRLVRTSITLASVSVLLAAMLVIALFLGALFRVECAVLITALFILCMASLIAALAFFIRDINLSLSAVELEIEQLQQGRASEPGKA